MTRVLLPVLLIALTISALADEIRPVRSWDDFRNRMISEGRTPAQADARISSLLGSLRTMDRDAGADRIGVAAPPFQFDAWMNTAPLSLEDLRGRVLLVRWWTDTCPFCASSAPALRTLHEQYGPRGLTVIGVFHPKARRNDPLDLPRVRSAVNQREFEFPITVDWNWQTGTLRDWWLTGPRRPATSVTFLIDRQGVIRFIHPGMEYHDETEHEETENASHAMCVDDMRVIRAEIERLLVR